MSNMPVLELGLDIQEPPKYNLQECQNEVQKQNQQRDPALSINSLNNAEQGVVRDFMQKID
ncbi:MAG: hypothetical protein FWD01_01190, partial [Defluviitaleaceae bacterium]|nr:hypothetical protein [Defluviitaleaceae bacterium]